MLITAPAPCPVVTSICPGCGVPVRDGVSDVPVGNSVTSRGSTMICTGVGANVGSGGTATEWICRNATTHATGSSTGMRTTCDAGVDPAVVTETQLMVAPGSKRVTGLVWM